ncbi:unnamed protein product, partial [Owenia fusiformis]
QSQKSPSTSIFNIDVITCDPVNTENTLEKRINSLRQRRELAAPPYHFTCTQANGYFQDIYDCTQYWKCTDSVPKIMKCPYLNRWSETKKNCDWRFRTTCNEADYTIPTTLAPTTVESEDQAFCKEYSQKTEGCITYVCWMAQWIFLDYDKSEAKKSECCSLYGGC